MKTILYFLLFSTTFIYAQCDLNSALKNQGFENLYTFQGLSSTKIQYENRRYRFEADALYYVLQTISKSECTSNKYDIIILNKGLPISMVSTSSSAIRALFGGDINYKQWKEESTISFHIPKNEKKVKHSNKSYLKSDIAVGVNIDYLLGNFDNPIRWTPMLQPEFQSTLAKGLTLTSKYQVILYDDFYYWEESRFRSAFLSYSGRLPFNIFSRISTGYFYETQFGVEGIISKFFFEDKIRLDGNVSLTENKFLEAPPFRRAIDKNHFQYGIKATYRNTKYLTDLSIHWGRYLFDDIGYSVELVRQFREVFIGFFMRDTTMPIVGSFGVIYDKNYGFFFQTPLGFKKHLKPEVLRLKTQEQYRLDYNYTGGVLAARRLTISNNVIGELVEYYPSTLSDGLKKFFD